MYCCTAVEIPPRNHAGQQAGQRFNTAITAAVLSYQASCSLETINRSEELAWHLLQYGQIVDLRMYNPLQQQPCYC